MRIKERDVIRITRILELPSGSHQFLHDLALYLELNPDTVFMGEFTEQSQSADSKLKQLIDSISYIDNPETLRTFLEFLNYMFDEGYYKDDKIEELDRILNTYAIKIEDYSNPRAVLLNSPVPSQTQSAIETVWPPELQNKLDDLLDRYKSSDVQGIAPLCRNILEELPRIYNAGSGYKNLLDKLKNKGLLRDKEGDFLKEFYNYVSSFEPIHPGTLPDTDRSLFLVSETIVIVTFLLSLLKPLENN